MWNGGPVCENSPIKFCLCFRQKIMACPTGRCALRRFDGHGGGASRPNNAALAAEGEARLAAMLAARSALDASCWGSAASKPALAPTPAPVLAQAPSTGYTPWRTPAASPQTK